MRTPSRAPERGATLIELMMALVVLAVGVLAVSQMFPAGSRSQLQSRMTTAASFYAQQQMEQLQGLSWSDEAIAYGRHPAAGYVPLGDTGQWHRWYEVSAMPAPLDNLKKVVVTVQWSYMGTRTVSDTTYLRR